MTDKKDISKLIKSYNASSVSHLEPLIHIRREPSMYVGSVSQNPNHLFEEALMNSIDEYAIGVAKQIVVRIHDDGSLEVKDDGRGMPPEYADKFKMPVARALLTEIDTGKSFESNDSTTSQHGVGMKAALATSDWLSVDIWRNDGKEYYDRYETIDDIPGRPVVKLVNDKNLPTRKPSKDAFDHGTRIRFKPSADVWKNPEFNWDKIKLLCKEISYLHPGLTFKLINDQIDETVEYREEGGIAQYVKNLAKQNEEKLITPVFSFDGVYDTGEKQRIGKETMKINATISFAWTNSASIKTALFTNNVPNPRGGTPVKGFNAGITRLMNKYVKDLSLSKDRIEQRDLLPGLITVISMTHPDPDFDGQTKKEITSANAKNALNTMVYNDAQLPMDRSIDEVKEVIKLAFKRASKRAKEDADTVNLKGKDVMSQVSKKLKQAKKLGVGSELFIVEGDSAAGTLIDERDNKFQAIMPLRGKVLNTYKATAAKSMANMEISTIFAAIGAGINKDFDISKANYSKIIIATDADADGSHISDLILTALIKFAPELIKKGYVYRAMSPLYVNKFKDGTEAFTYSEEEQAAFVKKTSQTKLAGINRNKGLGELTHPEVEATLMNPKTRKLLRYDLTDDNMSDAYNYLDIFMGSSAADRRQVFTDESRYVNVEI